MSVIQNPILAGFHPDPVICCKGADYYIATSTFEWFPGVRIFHSRNLSDWELVARPLDRVSQLDMRGNPDSGGVWAPCLTFADGLFWLIYSDVKAVDTPWKNGRNYLVTAVSVDGPWSEPIALGNGGFDPSLFHDDDGRKYLTYRQWGPRHQSNPNNRIVIQEYLPEERQLVPKRTELFTGTSRKFTEAPHLYKTGGFYYLVLAEGGTAYEHTVTVLRSDGLLGPYTLHPDEVIVTSVDHPDEKLQKAGHGSLIETHSGEWYIVYLVGRPLPANEIADADAATRPTAASFRGYCPLGRETAIDRIEWRGGWPYAAGGPQPKLQVPAPSFARDTERPPKLDDFVIDCFAGDTLHWQWQTLRIPFTPSIGTLLPARGVLRLYGRDSLISKFDQATLARRWQHFSFDAVTSLAFFPGNEQQLAGLTCYYNTRNWTGCFVGFDENLKSRTLRIIEVDRGQDRYYLYDDPISVPEAAQFVWVKVSLRSAYYRYSYSFDGEVWQMVDHEFPAWKLSDDHVAGKGFFTGAFVGMHCSDISGDGCHADFQEFQYLPMDGGQSQPKDNQ